MIAKFIDKDIKRRDIALAAMEVFSERGFEAASMSRVAAKAGVGKGTIYEYFPSKDELIATSIRIWMEQMIADAEEAMEKIPSPEERLRSYVHSFVDIFLTDEKMPRLIVSIFQLFMTKLHETTFGDTLKVMFRSGVSSIERIILEGVEAGSFRIEGPREAELIAVNLTAFLDGICLDYMATGGLFDLRAQVDHYLKYLLEKMLR